MADRAVRAVVSGRVQGVGYRAWFDDDARKRGLAGWVRNRRDGTVEAVFSGEEAAVEAMIAAAWKGPLGGHVADVAVAGYQGPPLTRFTILPTA